MREPERERFGKDERVSWKVVAFWINFLILKRLEKAF